MSIDLAALHDAADALAIAARAADEGRDADAVFALKRATLAGVAAFGPDSMEALCWSLVLDGADPEVPETPEDAEDDEPEVAL